MSEEPCCDDMGSCSGCTNKLFTTTFYFDSHQIQITGCAESVGEVEAALGDSFKGRIPKPDFD